MHSLGSILSRRVDMYPVYSHTYDIMFPAYYQQTFIFISLAYYQHIPLLFYCLLHTCISHRPAEHLILIRILADIFGSRELVHALGDIGHLI